MTQPAVCLLPQVCRLLCTTKLAFLPERYAGLLTEEEEKDEEEEEEEEEEDKEGGMRKCQANIKAASRDKL